MTIVSPSIPGSTVGEHDTATPAGAPGTLALNVSRPHADTVAISASGQIDENSAAHFAESLTAWLVAPLRTVVVDLSDVDFLAVTGLERLDRAQRRATEQGIALRLLATHPEVLRALRVAELDCVQTTGGAVPMRSAA